MFTSKNNEMMMSTELGSPDFPFFLVTFLGMVPILFFLNQSIFLLSNR